jgi:ADP-heptose:LPS heptosyltransferase
MTVMTTRPHPPVQPLSRAPRSILVIRMSGIGDVVWTTPLLANLRRAWPDAHIAYVARPAAARVLIGNPDVDEVIIFESERITWQIGLLLRLARRRFDLSIDLICSAATALQSWVAARTRVGFDFRGRRYLYNRALSRYDANHGHAVEFNLYAAEHLGIPIVTRALVWTVLDDERRAADDIVAKLTRDGRKLVVFIPTGGFPSKKWSADSYAALGRSLVARGDVRILIVWGSAAEHEEARAIAAGIGDEAVAADSTIPLRVEAAVFARCALAVGNDTGPLHIATAVGVPVVGLLGPVNDRSQGPWSDRAIYVRARTLDEPCCGKTDCALPRCMIGITPEQVADVCAVALDRPRTEWRDALLPLGARLREDV